VSIRTRILLVVVALVAVAMAILDVVSYSVVRRSLISRTDAQLQAASASFLQAMSLGADGTFCGGLPLNSFGALYSADGKKVLAIEGCPTAPSTSSLPVLPAGFVGQLGSQPVPGSVGPARTVTTGSVRIRAELAGVTKTVQTNFGPQDENITVLFVAGEPIAPLNATLDKLLALELIVSISILLAAGAAALFLVQLGLRPLDQMAKTADEIAAGDLSRRVEEPNERTEVGRLGRSLNIMLGRIETAFQAKEASESRLRRFVADASHELRTPLTSIRGYSELFRTGVANRPEDVATALRRIESESTRMSVLVEDLLLLARLDQGRPLGEARVDLLQLASDAVADAGVVAPDRQISVLPVATGAGGAGAGEPSAGEAGAGEPSAGEAGEDFVVPGDGPRLAQVVVNLLSNAVSHTPEGTPIEVVLRATPERVVVEVVDHGPGIPEDERERVFDRFWRADESRQRSKGGTGLGLSIVEAVASAHGGSVRLSETPGGGATFSVDLPRAARPSDEERPAAPDTGAPDTGVPGAGVPGAGVPDAGAPDTGAPNTGAPGLVTVVRASGAPGPE
jgi:two-component system OmpR family sensor kinase